MKQIGLYIIAGLLWACTLQGQEVLTGISTQAVLQNAARMDQQGPQKRATEALRLPFWDGFHQAEAYPKPNLWTDQLAFINTGFQYLPPTIGVATLDILDANGRIYSQASTFAQPADTLTSAQIRLDSLLTTNQPTTTADSLYLSFYYQPQGTGFSPEAQDSLLLQFKTKDTIPGILVTDSIIDTWNTVWAAEGTDLESFTNLHGNPFDQVMIPIRDSILYYQADFQFRFINYASLAENTLPSWKSNTDQWNLDYIYLNANRSLSDTFPEAVAFVNPAPSMLMNYQAMPYRQYLPNFLNEMLDTAQMLMSNLHNQPYNCSYKYQVRTHDNNVVYDYDGGDIAVEPFTQSGYVTHPPFAKYPIGFVYPFTSLDTISYEIEHVFFSDPNQAALGDTVRYTQYLYNYFAYDDGTAEAGYGVNKANGEVAYQFKMNQPDTLRAIQIFFNHVQNQANEKYFNLKVWRDFNGEPGEVIYEKPGLLPVFEDGLNGFHTYHLNDIVKVSNVFYVGWEQTTNDMLNVGMDRNHDKGEKIYYKIPGTPWNQSSFEGALMMRPVLGAAIDPSFGINTPQQAAFKVHFYPNPNHHQTLHLQLPEAALQHPEQYEIRLYNLLGKQLLQSPWQNQLSIGHLAQGIYLLQVNNKNQEQSYTGKLIITQ